VGGIFIISIILLLYLKNPFAAQPLYHLLLIALCLSFLALFRRWYAFWVVSFFITLTIHELIFSVRRGEYRTHLVSFGKIILTAFFAGLIFTICAWPYAERIITTDYSAIYSPYVLSF
jgi:hypothetical protein